MGGGKARTYCSGHDLPHAALLASTWWCGFRSSPLASRKLQKTLTFYQETVDRLPTSAILLGVWSACGPVAFPRPPGLSLGLWGWSQVEGPLPEHLCPLSLAQGGCLHPRLVCEVYMDLGLLESKWNRCPIPLHFWLVNCKPPQTLTSTWQLLWHVSKVSPSWWDFLIEMCVYSFVVPWDKNGYILSFILLLTSLVNLGKLTDPF